MKIFAEIEEGAVGVLKAAGHVVETFVITEAQKVVILLKQNEPLVTKTLNLISDLMSSTMSGADKMNKVISDIMDMVQEVMAEGGFSGIIARALQIVRQFAQSVFDDFVAGLVKVITHTA